MTPKFTVSYVLGLLLRLFGATWGTKILTALNSVPADTPFPQVKALLCEAVQHCDPDGGPTRVSGTLRGLICKAINSANSEEGLAAELLAIDQFLEKYAPAPA